jgi:hypothetical protein
MKEKFVYLFKKYFLPYFIFITFFLVISYVIVMLRMFSVETNLMPELTGKYFINVYNDLKKYNLNIEIRRIYIREKPEGIILQQSILPGETIKPKDRLVLLLNSYEPFLTMPDVTNSLLENAKEKLLSIPYENDIYRLEISKILYVYKNNVPENTVLYQYPAAGTKIKINEKIILIVSTLESVSFDTKILDQLDIGTASQYFMYNGKPYIITELIYTDKEDLNAKIRQIKFFNKTYEVSVYFNKNKKYRFYSDFELDNISFLRKEYCSIHLSNQNLESIEDIKSSKKIWFSEPEIFADKKFPLVFYRAGKTYLYLICNDRIISKRFYEPDFST